MIALPLGVQSALSEPEQRVIMRGYACAAGNRRRPRKSFLTIQPRS